MRVETPVRPSPVWLVVNVVGLLVLVGYAVVFTAFLILLSQPSDTYAVDRVPTWAAGAAVGLLAAILVSYYDRRYLPWTPAVMLAGAATTEYLSFGPIFGVPPLLFVGLLGVSAVLYARAGRDRAPVPSARRQWWTFALVTAAVLAVVGGAIGYVAENTQSTPLYDAMRADPMATDALPGMEVLVDRSNDQHTALGQLVRAQVHRTWMITDGSAPAAKLDQLADLAARAGWTQGPDPLDCGWQKVRDGHPLCLVLEPSTRSSGVTVTVRIYEDQGRRIRT